MSWQNYPFKIFAMNVPFTERYIKNCQSSLESKLTIEYGTDLFILEWYTHFGSALPEWPYHESMPESPPALKSSLTSLSWGTRAPFCFAYAPPNFLFSTDPRVKLDPERVHWGETPFRVKDDPEICQLSADLTNNGVRLTQLWVIFRVRLTDFPEWSLAPMDPFPGQVLPGCFMVLYSSIGLGV